MKSDIEIAQETKELPINEIAAKVGLKEEDLEPYGHDKAKITWQAINRTRASKKLGKLVLVTSISPTPAGEGKSTITIGLGDAIHNQLHQNTMIALREPSMGPVFWIKRRCYRWWESTNHPYGRYQPTLHRRYACFNCRN